MFQKSLNFMLRNQSKLLFFFFKNKDKYPKKKVLPRHFFNKNSKRDINYRILSKMMRKKLFNLFRIKNYTKLLFIDIF